MPEDHLHIVSGFLDHFTPISLVEMDDVKLMDRIDCKYLLSFNQLEPLLKDLAVYYKVLTIKNNKVFSYNTEYFDTPDLNMFCDHHNGKLNRYKVRQREYVESRLTFLEVKHKSNKGRVIKDRIEKCYRDRNAFIGFVHQFTPYNPEKLDIILVNRFNRFTMVDRNMKERVTVDFNLVFSDHHHTLLLKDLVIIEVKQSRSNHSGIIYQVMKDNGIRQASVSKYCLGVALLNRHRKINNFKNTIHTVNKFSDVEKSA